MTTEQDLNLGSSASKCWLDDPQHLDYLKNDAARQVAFFRSSLGQGAGFRTLDFKGATLPNTVQELHTTTRLIHSYALAHLGGYCDGSDVIDRGMSYLWSHHRDQTHGGYLWALDGEDVADPIKLAYGHVFVLLAASAATLVNHPDAARLMSDIEDVLDTHYWDDGHGLFRDEYERDWTPFSTYRGMNANMHGAEALLSAYEATGRTYFLDRAERILTFFLKHIAPEYGWRIPEHYTENWNVDPDYAGNPMFRPAGSTPGHSFEMARLLLQLWDLRGRPDDGSVVVARNVVSTALSDAWDQDKGGLIYTLHLDGTPDVKARYWWPVTEAIGAIATLIKVDATDEDEAWYRRLWQFADAVFVDKEHGGWFPEVGPDNRPNAVQFHGKPDIYHSLQAVLIPQTDTISRLGQSLHKLR